MWTVSENFGITKLNVLKNQQKKSASKKYSLDIKKNVFGF